MKKKILLVGDAYFAAEICKVLSHVLGDIETITDDQDALRKVIKKAVKVMVLDDDSCSESLRKQIFLHGKRLAKKVIVVSSDKRLEKMLAYKSAGASEYIVKPYHYREFITRFNAIAENKMRVVCIGGGTGLFHLLMGLKTIPNTLLFSIVGMTDDGGSSGRLKTSFGILPPGDIRRSLVALSNAPELMNRVMQFRFSRGGHFSGHNFGNLFLAALAELTGSMDEAVRGISDLLYTQGIVLPGSGTHATLCARFENGKVIKGESAIDLCKGRDPMLRITKIWHEPESVCDQDAFLAIMNADVVVLGPGDLYTSILTNFVVKDIRKAFLATKAKKIYIGNLMTKPGETASYDAAMHLKEIIRYLGGDRLDYAIFSNTYLSPLGLKRYAKKGQVPVLVNKYEVFQKITKAKIIVSDVGHETELVRHDSEKLKREIEKIMIVRNGLH